jgi:hypothetical protein
MGLALEVGYLADRLKSNSDDAEKFRGQLAELNNFLQSQNMPLHTEPEACPVFKCTLRGYSGFHYLQRMAAFLDLKGRLPKPGDDDSYKDPIIKEYYRKAQPNFFQKLFRLKVRQRHFDHLLYHSACEGFYLPQDFPEVLRLPHGDDEWSRMLGSSHQLKAECARIAQALELPLDIDPDCDELWQEAAKQKNTRSKWRMYQVESYTCLQMYSAAEHSIEEGALLVFC